MKDHENLSEYMWLKPTTTGMKVDIFVDDGMSYQRHEHELLLLVRNGYARDIDEFIPFSISKEPCMLDKDIELEITDDDVKCVLAFIQTNIDALQKIANQDITQETFVAAIRKTEPREATYECHPI